MNYTTRGGNFTSSEIFQLMTLDRSGKGFGKPALTYIEDKNYERLLSRYLNEEKSARPLDWGKLLESRVFELLGLEYTLTSTETDIHHEFNYWCGSKDGTKEGQERAVIDIKCPITLKSFVGLVKPLYDGLTGNEAINLIRENHKDGEKYYWQLVSNAILNNCEYAELIVYMPYQSELEEIKRLADGNVYWIQWAEDNQLPYILDNGYFKNINVIRFKVPQEDKDLLTERVKLAGTMLIERPILNTNIDNK